MHRRSPPILLAAALGACSAPVSNPPPLTPRAAETIDPRLPVSSPVAAEPPSAALVASLAALVEQARAGNSAFRAAIDDAERLAAAAGAAESESWIAAQQALSVAIAARGPTTRAVADIDELAARTIASSGGIPAGDLQAIEAAAGLVAQIAESQAGRIDAVQARLR